MPHFVCARCCVALTPLLVAVGVPEEVPYPGRAEDGTRGRAARMVRGTYARQVRPNLFVREPRGFLIHPDDLINADLDPDWGMGCCGANGGNGINVVCDGCGSGVATWEDDCWTQRQVTLDFAAVIRSFTGD